jgi:hypothetical protein
MDNMHTLNVVISTKDGRANSAFGAIAGLNFQRLCDALCSQQLRETHERKSFRSPHWHGWRRMLANQSILVAGQLHLPRTGS